MEEILRAQAEAGEFGPVDIEAEVERRMALLRSGGSTGTMQRARPNGRMLELRRNPIAGGGFVTLYTDVTARHHAEERVRQAQKMAAVGRLTAGIAHDFNNLLSSIIGNADLLERDIGEYPKQARLLGVIIQCGRTWCGSGAAIARVCPQAAAGTGLGEPERGRPRYARIAAIHRGTWRAGGYRLAGDLWPALVDPVQIEHVILNLAINARDAMPAGGVLTITTANLMVPRPGAGEDMAAGDYVGVAVTDTGTGMSEEVLRNAFEPFFTTKPVGQGSGLGLSQVYGLATQSGGGVQIDSELGRGTTVTVLLPRADPAALPAGQSEERSKVRALP